MKVLLVHARYALAGGEERVVDAQSAVLSDLGHTVLRYEEENAEIGDGAAAKARAAAGGIWSRRSRRALAALLDEHKPDVVHVHNTFPRVSPSVYAAANDANVPVIQHLHNARLVCIQPFLVRDGAPCDACVGRTPWPGVVYRCYRDSLAASAAAAGVQVAHRAAGTWRRRVTRFAAVSEALAQTYRASGVVPDSKLVVCENGLDHDPGARLHSQDEGYALCVGRLSYEKGVDTLIDAARAIPDVRVLIAGDGPERAALEQRAVGAANVEFLGHVERGRVFELLRGARVLVVPSRGQEPFGMTAVEAAAVGVPAIATRMGGLAEVVRDGATGVLVGDDATEVADALRRMGNRDEAAAFGGAARREFEMRFSPGAYGARLAALYEDAIGQPP